MYVETRSGQLHCAQSGSGFPIVFLHQTPRSSDEYREVLTLLPNEYRGIAPDLPGMGGSDELPNGASVEGYADAMLGLLDALELREVHLVGHHTGGVVATEVAAREPERIRALVLSSTPLMDAEGRSARVGRDPIDQVAVKDDGSHLLEMWNRRASFYPQGRSDLLNRYVRDALSVTDVEAGHEAVARYVMEDRIGRLDGSRVLCIGHDADPHAYPELDGLVAAIPGAHRTVVRDGMVPLEYRAEVFTDAVVTFVSRFTPTG